MTPRSPVIRSFEPMFGSIQTSVPRVISRCVFLLVTLVGVALNVRAGTDRLTYGFQSVDGIELFYREGGPRDAPTLVFLHGNPSSSIMYEKVMEQLIAARRLHVIA